MASTVPEGKVSIGSFPLVYPIPIVLVGANVAGAPNYENVGNCAIGGFGPGLVFISSVRTHYTNQGILENGTFSVNLPTTSMIPVTDYCGLASGRNVDKGSLFSNFYGELGTAPMIEECPVNLECRVVHEFTYGDMQMFIGEIANAYVDRRFARQVPDMTSPETEPTARAAHWRFGGASLAEFGAVIYHLDLNYYEAGNVVGRAFRDGRVVKAPDRRGGGPTAP